MAIGRISGAMLKANLERLGSDLAFDTDLLYLDVTNDRIGINTSSPTQSLQVDNVTNNSSQNRSTSGALDLGAPADITIPKGYGTALRSPQAEYWKAAIIKEYTGIMEQNVWETMRMSDLPEGANLINCLP